MRKRLTTLLLLTPLLCSAQEIVSDSIYMESVSVSTIKQGVNLRQQPIASTTLGEYSITSNQILSMKDMQYMVPNFYMPDYGSRITSSIYVRGLGARIDNSVVGFNIDNVPYLNKNAFDTDIMQITRMEILRGPQSTLYGRNTMGGVVNIYTLSPMDFEGVKIGASYGNGNTYRANAAIYNRFSDRFAASLSGFYSSSDGLYNNEYNSEKCDTEQEVGGQVRMVFKPTTRTTFDNTTTTSILNQGGYPYRWMESGEINYNDPSSYARTMVSNGLTATHRRDNYTLSSVTGYQYLDDCMVLDNDFTPDPIFTLQQAITEHTITEDVVIRSHRDDRYNYLFGAFGFYKNQRMGAPVTFLRQGIDELILGHIPGGDKYTWWGDSFRLASDFRYNTLGAALYHESRCEVGKWRFSAALRLDYEMAMLRYHSYTSTGATQHDNNGNVVWEKAIDIDLKDDIKQDFIELLPKVSATYNIDKQNSLYATISKGYKAGGYNTQMFSDILTQEMMSRFGLSSLYTPEEIIKYKPEYSWNYEVGGHFANESNTLRGDVALFYIDCRDQQLTIFPDDMVTGRLMTNAGESRSYGAEASIMARRGAFTLNGSYGYTNAKFIEYNDNKQDFAGRYIPYAPRHTLYAALRYNISVGRDWLSDIDIEANTNGVGKIYWNESNSRSQPLYALLGASLTLSNKDYNLTIWGRNLTNKRYDTFYFMSMGNEFTQQGLPTTFGATLNITIK